jgi:hypothetical protein
MSDSRGDDYDRGTRKDRFQSSPFWGKKQDWTDFNEALRAAMSRNTKVINKVSANEYLFTVHPVVENVLTFPKKFVLLPVPEYLEHSATEHTAAQKANRKKEIESANEINAQLNAVITAWTLILQDRLDENLTKLMNSHGNDPYMPYHELRKSFGPESRSENEMSGTVDEFSDLKMKHGQLLSNVLVEFERVALRSGQTVNNKRNVLISWKTLNVGMRQFLPDRFKAEVEWCRQQNLNFDDTKGCRLACR